MVTDYQTSRNCQVKVVSMKKYRLCPVGTSVSAFFTFNAICQVDLLLAVWLISLLADFIFSRFIRNFADRETELYIKNEQITLC